MFYANFTYSMTPPPQAPHMFSFASCKFAVQRCKESTGRVVMWRRGVPNSFTMEATFCGSTLGHSPQFTSDDLMEMGKLLGEAMFRLHRLTVSKRCVYVCMRACVHAYSTCPAAVRIVCWVSWLML